MSECVFAGRSPPKVSTSFLGYLSPPHPSWVKSCPVKGASLCPVELNGLWNRIASCLFWLWILQTGDKTLHPNRVYFEASCLHTLFSPPWHPFAFPELKSAITGFYCAFSFPVNRLSLSHPHPPPQHCKKEIIEKDVRSCTSLPIAV